ncbi:transcription factor TFIIIC subunit tfc4, partial [Rhizopus stolonifer]
SLRYTGFYAFRKGKVKNRDTDNLNEEAHSMANRLRTRIPMNKWLRMIMRYAYVLTTFKRSLEAYNVLLKAISANVFYHDNPKKQALYLTMIGCGMIGKRGTMVQEGARWLCNYRQHKNDGFRIYAALVDSGYKDPTMYVSQNQLKYLTRMVRLMDAMVGNKNKENEGNNREQIRLLNEEILAMNIDPAAASENYYTRYYHTPTAVPPPIVKKMNVEGLSSLNPILLCLYGHMMTLSRSAVAASLFHMRAYAVAPKDRLNTLSLGISLLHTAIQRKSDDRHMQIVQGMMFIYEYAKLSGHNQESEYNIGRAFHLLGLTHLAVTHYEKVLCMPAPSKAATRQPKPFDKAAYNLHLIYITSGSLSLAQILLQKYCAV